MSPARGQPRANNKADAGNDSDGSCRVIDASRSPSLDTKRSVVEVTFMAFRIYSACALLLLLVGAWVPVCSGQEPGSFRLDPKTGKFKDGKRDYSHADAADVIKLVLTDWMTNPKVKNEPYGYLIDAVDVTGKGPKPKLERLLVDERYVPKGFDLIIPGVEVKLFDRSKRDLKIGEMCIRMDRFEPKKDGTIEVEFLHSGYRIFGGDWVTYGAKKAKGKWVVEFSSSFDP